MRWEVRIRPQVNKRTPCGLLIFDERRNCAPSNDKDSPTAPSSNLVPDLV